MGLNSFNFCNFFNSVWSFSCWRPLVSSSSSFCFKISSLAFKSSSVFSFSSLNFCSFSCISSKSFSKESCSGCCFCCCFVCFFEALALPFFGEVRGWERLSWFSFSGSLAGGGGTGLGETFPAKMLASLVDGVFSFRALLVLLFFVGTVSMGITATVSAIVGDKERAREAWVGRFVRESDLGCEQRRGFYIGKRCERA